jgi:hypothetical protein
VWSAVLDAYQTLEPARWVAVYRELPWWAGALAAALGAFLVVAGGGAAFRLVAAPAGAAMGFVWGPALASRFAVDAPSEAVAWIAAAIICAASFVIPQVAVVVAFGVPAGFVGAHIAGSDRWTLGFLLGLAVGGTIGVLLARPVACISASSVGAWLFVLGALAALQPIAPWAASAARAPWAVILVASAVAIGGSIYQLFLRRPAQTERRSRRDSASTPRMPSV